MARIDTLPHFLTDVADAIREKTGESGTIQASSFDTAIANIPSGGGLDEYFTSTITSGTASLSGYEKSLKKIPALTNTGTTCDYMFYKFNGEELDLSNFNTSNVSSMIAMFRACPNIKKIDASSFITTNITNISDMFRGCDMLEEIDLSNAETPSLINMNGTFLYLWALQKLDIRKFDFTNVSQKENAFAGVPTNCLIIVKDQTAKNWVLTQRSDFTNVKTVAEYEAEQNQ